MFANCNFIVLQKLDKDYPDGHKWPDSLLKPSERLEQYVLFIKNINEELRKLNSSSPASVKALKMLENVIRKGNELVTIESIEYSDIKRDEYGYLIMSDIFNIVSRFKLTEVVVFLFSNVIVFAIKNRVS